MEEMRQSKSGNVGLVVVIVVVLLAIVLIAVDLSCFVINKRGVVMTVMQRLGRTGAAAGKNELEIEKGEK